MQAWCSYVRTYVEHFRPIRYVRAYVRTLPGTSGVTTVYWYLRTYVQWILVNPPKFVLKEYGGLTGYYLVLLLLVLGNCGRLKGLADKAVPVSCTHMHIPHALTCNRWLKAGDTNVREPRWPSLHGGWETQKMLTRNTCISPLPDGPYKENRQCGKTTIILWNTYTPTMYVHMYTCLWLYTYN